MQHDTEKLIDDTAASSIVRKMRGNRGGAFHHELRESSLLSSTTNDGGPRAELANFGNNPAFRILALFSTEEISADNQFQKDRQPTLFETFSAD